MMSSSGSPNTSRKWTNSLGLKPWMLTLREFALYMRQQIEVPLLRELGMMPALHEDLRAAQRHRLLDLPVHFLEGDNVGVASFSVR
jgi:hypothetical protein